MTRPPAPRYRGEGPHALWHVSEEPSIERFEPRPSTSLGLDRADGGAIEPTPTADTTEPLVWAIDTRHQPMFWFPRDCPRGTFWAGPATSTTDVDRFLDGDGSRRVHAMETDWLDRMRTAGMYAYRMPEETFRPHETVGGYWVSTTAVRPIERVELGDLLSRHAAAGIELRIVPSIWPLWDRVVASSLEFSGSRLRNARPRIAGNVRRRESDPELWKWFRADGRLERMPAAPADRRTVLERIAERFERGREYAEGEVNVLLTQVDADFATLRRYLIDERILDRSRGRYRLR